MLMYDISVEWEGIPGLGSRRGLGPGVKMKAKGKFHVRKLLLASQSHGPYTQSFRQMKTSWG